MESAAGPEVVIPEGGLIPPPAIPQPNIFPMEWHVNTPRLAEIYERSKIELWNLSEIPWDTLDPQAFTWEQRVGLMYWFALLANFDASGPAVFARATIQAFETHEEDPIRKCFFGLAGHAQADDHQAAPRRLRLPVHGALGAAG